MPIKKPLNKMMAGILAIGAIALVPVHAATVTKDAINARESVLMGNASYTLDAGGHTGKAGDRALDLRTSGSWAHVPDAKFLNDASKNDEMTFALWMKRSGVADSYAFWATSQASATRAFSAHVPWSNADIYFDTAGCCDTTTQRINANIETYSGYTFDASWWTNWHHYAFTKKGEIKQIWIDGVLFLEGSSTGVLPADFTVMFIGSQIGGANSTPTLIDDFAVFTTALTEAQVNAIFKGTTSPKDLTAAKPLAYWAFDDMPADGIITTTSPAPNSGTAAPNLVKVAHMDGSFAWDTSKVSLKIDDTAVQATVTKDGAITTVSYVPSPLFGMQTAHKAALLYPGADGTQKTYEWNFMVGAYTKDSVKSHVGALRGPAKFSTSGGGKSGQTGDYAIDFGNANAGQAVHVADAAFINEATRNDELAVVSWQKLHAVADSALVWIVSPSSSGTQRGFSAHTPWSNNNIYFDTAGCCDASTQRINAGIVDFPEYTGDASWWTNWHHIVFQKKGSTKEIWIDGILFLSGENTSPLPTDVTQLYMGFDPPDNAALRGLIDDFAIFGTALTEAKITQLKNGTLPSALPASDKLMAYWNFNDVPAEGLFTSITPAPFATSAAPNQVKVTHMDGSAPWDTTKVSLKVDNATVPANITKAGGIVTISYPSQFAPLSSHKAAVVYTDAAGAQKSFEWPFTVFDYTPVYDTIKNYFGMLRQAAKFTPDAGGHTAKAGDYAIDLGRSAASVYVPDASFINDASKNDEMTFAIWVKKYDIVDGSTFWANAPSAGGARGFQAHTPWSNGNIYFDTSGCCDATTQRINQGIDQFPDFTGDNTWWNEWRHYAFSKKGEVKQIWIDGKLFMEGTSTAPLATDFTDLYIGADGAGGSTMHALIDDFAVFGKALTEANVNALFRGTTSPKNLTAAQPLAYWDFNTLPVVAPVVPMLQLARTANGIVLTFEGALQSADVITGPWADVTGASPLTVTPTGSGKFYRAKR